MIDMWACIVFQDENGYGQHGGYSNHDEVNVNVDNRQATPPPQPLQPVQPTQHQPDININGTKSGYPLSDYQYLLYFYILMIPIHQIPMKSCIYL